MRCGRAERAQSMRAGTSGASCGARDAHREHPELQRLMRGCDALILQKQDKIDQNRLPFGSKCEKALYYIKVDPKQCPCVVNFRENSIEVCCF